MAKQRRRLTKKQFIIGIVAICGIALIIEGALLIRMFTKNRKKPDTEEKKPVLVGGVEPEKGRTAESYIRREYQTYSDYEPELKTVKQVEYDDNGRLYHVYLWENLYYRGPPYERQYSSEVFYSYDEHGKVLQEDWAWKNYYPRTEESYESKEQISYEYKDGDSPEVLIQTVDGNGELKSRTEEKYNENGIPVSHTKYEYYDGNEIKTEDKTFDEHGNVISEVLVKLDDEGKVKWTEKNTFSYYESGVKKTSSEEDFDENNLMKRLRSSRYNECGIEISRDVFNKDGLKHEVVYDENERKVTNELLGDKYFFDEQSRIIRWEKEGGTRIEEKTFFYTKDGMAANRITGYEHYDNSGKELLSETIYDSKGRILQSVEVDANGNETRIQYNWDYRDLGFPNRDVLQQKTYENGKLVKEALFQIKPIVDDEDLQKWNWSYGSLLVMCWHLYHNEQDEGEESKYHYICADYVSPYGQYHLEPIYYEVFDKETGNWSVVTEATFYQDGALKSVRSEDMSCTWYFDNRGNHIKTEERNKDGTLVEVIDFEYTYYKGVSGETPEP